MRRAGPHRVGAGPSGISNERPVTTVDSGSAPLAVQMRGIVKRFDDLVAVNDVDFDLRAGEVHALLGENGAGKTTLMNVLSGLLRPDRGHILLNGEPARIRAPRDALRRGIGMVHQHYRLVHGFTVAENIHLGWDASPTVLTPARIEERTRELSDRFHLEVDPAARIWQLSVGEQQRVAILRTLARGARILILDEPTAVLAPGETDQLFGMIRQLSSESGRTIVFISHKLEEALAISDRVTVLRGGRHMGTHAAEDCSPRMLSQEMVGRSIEFTRQREPVELGENALVAEALSTTDDRGLPALREVDVTVRAGEIVGVAGVAGNGQRELSETLTGLRALTAGRIHVGGQDLSRARARDFLAAGVGHIPEDRYASGLVLTESIEHNAILRAFQHPPVRRGPLLVQGAARRFARMLAKTVGLSISDVSAPVRSLSGGNAQRLLTGRELNASAHVLVVVHPTRGLDVGAIEEVQQVLLRARATGVAILLISEDLNEVMRLSDRILVLYRGAIVGEFTDPEQFDLEEIGLLMGGALAAAS